MHTDPTTLFRVQVVASRPFTEAEVQALAGSEELVAGELRIVANVPPWPAGCIVTADDLICETQGDVQRGMVERDVMARDHSNALALTTAAVREAIYDVGGNMLFHFRDSHTRRLPR